MSFPIRSIQRLSLLAACLGALLPLPSIAADGVRRLAVLEFRGDELVGTSIVRQLADEARGGALDAFDGRPGYQVFTHENQAAILRDAGRSPCCSGDEVEIDVGDRLGAAWIVTGEVSSVDQTYRLSVKLFDTSSRALLSMENVEASGLLELVRALRGAAAALVAQGLGLQGQTRVEAADSSLEKEVEPGAAGAHGEQAEPAVSGAHDEHVGPAMAGMRGELVEPVIARIGGESLEPRSGLVFVRLPGGTFRQGCASGDLHCRRHELPRRRASVPAFSLGKSPVTEEAYARCMDAGTCSPRKVDLAACRFDRTSDQPVTCVDFDQAATFCAWAGGRLPTATEWEYAAKSGRDVLHPWGNAPVTDGRANFCDSNCVLGVSDPTQDDGWSTISPVGAFPDGATPWGILDMAGNVWEWTSTGLGLTRELRGGSWASRPISLRVSAARWADPSFSSDDIGFRCALQTRSPAAVD